MPAIVRVDPFGRKSCPWMLLAQVPFRVMLLQSLLSAVKVDDAARIRVSTVSTHIALQTFDRIRFISILCCRCNSTFSFRDQEQYAVQFEAMLSALRPGK